MMRAIRPVLCAAISVVPEPANASSTSSKTDEITRLQTRVTELEGALEAIVKRSPVVDLPVNSVTLSVRNAVFDHARLVLSGALQSVKEG